MDLEIRSIGADEFDLFMRRVELPFGEQPNQEFINLERLVFEPDRSLAVFDRGEIVGTAGALSFDLTVPGAVLATAGVTSVGVAPTHRRRGLLTQLMRRQLDDVRDRGEPLAALWASEGGIYGRFGYGAAAFAANFEIERARTTFIRALDDGGSIRLADRADALPAIRDVFERVRGERPGTPSRNDAAWQVRFADLEQFRDGASPFFYALHESPSTGVDGYAAYRVKHQHTPEGFAANRVIVEELMAATPEAYASLWRYCFDLDLVAAIEAWPRPVDEPLLLMLSEPRRLRLSIGDGLWLRLVDVGSALEGRRYATTDRVVLGIRDGFCPWNEGRFLLEGGPDGAECRPHAADADIELGAADLAAAFLGGVSFRMLARALRAREATPGALARADAMFSHDPAPWCPSVF